MKHRMNQWKTFQAELGKASPLVKAVLSAVLVLSCAALIALRLAQWEARDATRQLLERAAELEQENRQLEEMVGELGTVSGIRRIAAQELGLVDPNTIIFDSE